jgi:hypothetical protein
MWLSKAIMDFAEELKVPLEFPTTKWDKLVHPFNQIIRKSIIKTEKLGAIGNYREYRRNILFPFFTAEGDCWNILYILPQMHNLSQYVIVIATK